MVRDISAPTRQELSDRADKHAEDMEKTHQKLEMTAEDIRTIRGLVEQLDPGGGTAEGIDEVEQSVERAEDVTEEVFDTQDGELEQIHSENEDYQDEVQDRKGISEANLGRVSDVTAPMETQEAIDELRKGKEAFLDDIDALLQLVDRAREACDRSKQVVDDLRQIRRSEG